MSAATDALLAPWRSRRLDLGPLRMHFLDEGPAGATPVLLLHGNPTWCYYWRTLIPHLARPYRVIVPDHAGCGLSDKPQRYPYTLERHVSNLETLCDYLGVERVWLGLHDWGGAIGMGYAVRHPERVAGFVVFNSAAFHLPACPLRIRACRVPLLGALLVRGLNGFGRGALRYATVRPERFDASVRAGYLAPYRSWRTRVAIHRFVRDIPLEPDHPSRAELARIEAGLEGLRDRPMQILWGAEDFCFTVHRFLDEWRRRFPDAEVHVLERAGHYVVEDAHERVGPLMRGFIDRHEAARRR